MIEYLRGKVVERTPTGTILEVNGGVGYFLSISLNTYNSIKVGEETKLLVHEVLREDTHDLYGFGKADERQLFRLLITVNGVGPATARLALSTYTPTELSKLIVEGNETGLKAIKGVGVRTAQRIIVELKDKIEGVMGELGQDLLNGGGTAGEWHGRMYEEAEKAFIALGYPASAAKKVVQKLAKAEPDISINDMIKKGLQML
ncbi:MAG: Holliday junction branch migration protein RuvA [Porphyromonas sp.]|nr:Holliday junction branch migration protein RuvA [Porphyromonas sp.]